VGGVLRFLLFPWNRVASVGRLSLTAPLTIARFPPTEPRLGCIPSRPDAAHSAVITGVMMRGGVVSGIARRSPTLYGRV
jgi:hypothetical protein